MAERTGELAVVVFEETDGEWRPSQVFTRTWTKFYTGREGWSYQLYDGDWCRRDQQLHLYNSGGGHPYVGGYVEPESMPGRIWLADGETVTGTSNLPDENGERVTLSLVELKAMGYSVVSEHPGDIFDGASDEPVTWCEKCEDYLPRYDHPCEHMVTCWHCGESFTEERPDDRCPGCNESQPECEQCEEPGASRCIACGRALCTDCVDGHDGASGDLCDQKVQRPAPARALQREAKRRRARLRKRRGWA